MQQEIYFNPFLLLFDYNNQKFILNVETRELIEINDEFLYEAIAKGIQNKLSFSDYKLIIDNKEIYNFLITHKLITDKPPNQYIKHKLSNIPMQGKYYAIHIITSLSCNLSCQYCFMLTDVDKLIKGQVISTTDIVKGIEKFLSFPHTKNIVVTFYGGEPLLYPSLIDFTLEFLKKVKDIELIYPTIITNGTIYNNKIENLLSKYGLSLNIEVSLDGDEKAHNYFRYDKQGRGTFDKVLNFIDKLRSYGFPVKILTTIGSHNVDRLPEIAEFYVKELKPDMVALNIPRALPKSDNKLGDVTDYYVSQYFKATEILLKHNIIESNLFSILYLLTSEKVALEPCAAAGHEVAIGPNGFIGPCHAFLSAGKFRVKIDDFNDIEKDDSPFKVFKNINKLTTSPCNTCNISLICGGLNCIYDRYNLGLGLYRTDQKYCKIKKSSVEFLLKLIVENPDIIRKQLEIYEKVSSKWIPIKTSSDS
jgi:uncharacterized protein